MMKKILLVVMVLTVLSSINKYNIDEFIIPDEAIRLRIIANSNSQYDQKIKEKVRNNLQKDMYQLLSDTKKIDEARNIINENMFLLDKNIQKTLEIENYKLGYTIDYGKHYFPVKNYKGVTYNEGYYESLLVKLGKGEGNNWWCVLFPPLCLIEAEESTEVEYKFFVKEIINKFFK